MHFILKDPAIDQQGETKLNMLHRQNRTADTASLYTMYRHFRAASSLLRPNNLLAPWQVRFATPFAGPVRLFVLQANMAA